MAGEIDPSLSALLSPRQPGGLFGSNEPALDPSSQGLLAAGFKALASSGPSLMPTSFGQILGDAGLSGLQSYRQAQEAQTINALRQAQLGKIRQDKALAEWAMKGGAGNFNDPDRLEQLGYRLSLGGHAGGATLIEQAQKIRAQRDNAAAVDSMRSSPGILGAGVTANSPQGQALLSNLSGDRGFDQDVIQAQNEALNSNPGLRPKPVQAANPGIVGALSQSPYVGPAAQSLQRQIDASRGVPAQTYLTQVQHLQQMDQTARNAAEARGAREDLQRELAGLRGDTHRDLQDQRRFSNEQSLAKDYNSLTKNFRSARSSFDSSVNYVTGKDYNSSGDRDLAFAYAKMLDPNDRVGVNDVKDINKLGNVPERIQQAISSLAEGKELPDRVREEMFGVIRRRFGALNEQQQQIENEYEDRAKRNMLRPDNVVTRYSMRQSGNPMSPQGGNGWAIIKVEKP